MLEPKTKNTAKRTRWSRLPFEEAHQSNSLLHVDFSVRIVHDLFPRELSLKHGKEAFIGLEKVRRRRKIDSQETYLSALLVAEQYLCVRVSEVV